MTPADGFVGVITSVVLACAVTFVVASVLLKTDRSDAAEEDLDAATRRMREMKAESKGVAPAAAARSACRRPSVTSSSPATPAWARPPWAPRC